MNNVIHDDIMVTTQTVDGSRLQYCVRTLVRSSFYFWWQPSQSLIWDQTSGAPRTPILDLERILFSMDCNLSEDGHPYLSDRTGTGCPLTTLGGTILVWQFRFALHIVLSAHWLEKPWLLTHVPVHFTKCYFQRLQFKNYPCFDEMSSFRDKLTWNSHCIKIIF